MNTNSVTKLCTAVGFFVVTVFGQPGFAAATGSKEECVAKAARTKKQACNSEADPVKKQACIANASSEAADDPECAALSSKDEARENDSACTDAYKKYQEDLGDAQSACESVTGSSTGSSRYTTGSKNSCTDKIKECAQLAQQTSNQTEQSDNGMSSTINIFRAVVDGDSSLGLSGGSQCLVDIDSKEARDAEKEFRDRRKEMEKDKKEIENDAIKDKEDNDKEITRITKEVQELQRNNKETLAKADVKMREQLNSSQKDMVDSASRLRNLTTQITKKNDSVRALNFAYSDRMLDSSAQKQNLRCKSALDQAKNCMIKSAKGIKDDSCKDFPFTIKSKGPKATAELKAQLQVVNDACYEKEDRDKKKMAFDQQEQMKRVNDEMSELQAQAKEEGQRQQIQSENSTKIQQEAEREKQEAQANMAEQIATLQGEMAQFAQKLQLKSQKSQERLAQLAQDLQKLELEEKTGKRSKTSLASRAVRKSNSQMSDVIYQCGCAENLREVTTAKAGGGSKVTSGVCKQLKGSLPSNGEEKKSRGSKSTSSI